MQVYANITRPNRVSESPDGIDKILELGNLMPSTDHIDASARKLVSRTVTEKKTAGRFAIRGFNSHILLGGTIIVVIAASFIWCLVGIIKLAGFLIASLPGV